MRQSWSCGSGSHPNIPSFPCRALLAALVLLGMSLGGSLGDSLLNPSGHIWTTQACQALKNPWIFHQSLLEEGKKTRRDSSPVLQKPLVPHAIPAEERKFPSPPASPHPPRLRVPSLELPTPVLGIWHNPGKRTGAGDREFCDCKAGIPCQTGGDELVESLFPLSSRKRGTGVSRGCSGGPGQGWGSRQGESPESPREG